MSFLFYMLKKNLKADAIGNIPLSMVMDAINEASANVSVMLDEKFANPPTPIRSIRKQTNKAKSNIDTFYTVINIPDVLDVYEVWRITLDNQEYEEVFVILSAVCELAGYKKPTWSDVKYCGFYSTVDEAINEIYARLA